MLRLRTRRRRPDLLPRRKSAMTNFAVVAISPLVITAVPLMAAAVALALGDAVRDRGRQLRAEPRPRPVFPTASHARHIGSYRRFLDNKTPDCSISCPTASADFAAYGSSLHAR